MKRSTTRLAVAAAAALTTAAGLAGAGITGASAASRPHAEHFRLFSGNVDDSDLTMVFSGHGPISGVGVAKADDDVPGTTIPLIVTLPGGTLRMKARGHFTWHPNVKTCTATEHDRGRWTITGGTGKYAHAHGSGTYVENGAGLGRRDADGVCQQSFRINYVVVSASGKVRR